MHAPYDKFHQVSSLLKVHQHVLKSVNMKYMKYENDKYEVLGKQ